MHLLRVTFALLAFGLLLATASADLRSPVLGETSLLSSVPVSRTWQPAIATDGNTTYVAYMEERTGMTVNRISATGTEAAGRRRCRRGARSQSRTRTSRYPARTCTWPGSRARSRPASATPSSPRATTAGAPGGGRSGRPPTGGGAWDLPARRRRGHRLRRLQRQFNRIWSAGSRDGAQELHLLRDRHEPGDSGTVYDVAVDGQHVHWSRRTSGIGDGPPLQGRRAYARAGRARPRSGGGDIPGPAGDRRGRRHGRVRLRPEARDAARERLGRRLRREPRVAMSTEGARPGPEHVGAGHALHRWLPPAPVQR